jgi:hypothetical protein
LPFYPFIPSRKSRQYKRNKILKKDQLKNNKLYLGHCRNSTLAYWCEELGIFIYQREKFGSKFLEDLYHPEDAEPAIDVFIPHVELNEVLTNRDNTIVYFNWNFYTDVSLERQIEVRKDSLKEQEEFIMKRVGEYILEKGKGGRNENVASTNMDFM